MTRRGLATIGAVLVMGGVTAGCLGEHANETGNKAFAFEIVNNSDEPIYYVINTRREDGRRLEVQPDDPVGNYFAVAAGDATTVGQGGPATVDQPDGGCFRGQQQWVVLADTPPESTEGDVTDLGAIEVLTYLEPGACTDQERIVWEYNG